MNRSRPIFVSGCPKSGTTLVAKLLSNSPGVMLDYDLTVATIFIQGYVERCMKSPIVMMDAYSDLINVRSKEIFESGWFELSAKEFFGSLHTGWHHDCRWGSSAKSLLFSKATVQSLYPESTWVFVLRDPRDTWASVKNADWPGQEWTQTAEGFSDIYMKYFREISDDVCLIRYEDVLLDPSIVYKTVGVKAPEAPLDGVGEIFARRTLPRPLGPGSHADVLVNRKDRWKTELNAADLDAITKVCADVFEKRYYE